MERVGALINKLKNQYDQNVDKNSLLVTVQLLLAELQQEKREDASKAKVSVLLPRVHKIVQDVYSVEPESIQQIQAPAEPDKPKERSPGLRPPSEESVYNYLHPSAAREHEEAIKAAEKAKQVSEKKEQNTFGKFDPMQDVPTLSHQKEVYELNDVHIDGGSLNDKLKEEKNELGSTIKDPVKDLKKAIGINDRFRFINELFRGDEIEYDRSVKTINGFADLAEAEHWMQRELKLKLGWSDNSHTVKDFIQIVKRRFS